MLKPSVRVRSGGQARVAGRLVNPDGTGIAGAEVRVHSSSPISPEEIVAVLQTDAEGRYSYTAAGSTSRSLRFAYTGSPLVLPAERTISMSVPAKTSLRVSRRRVLNGQAVEFSGKIGTQPVSATGKLVELQARLSDRWQTFRTTRTRRRGSVGDPVPVQAHARPAAIPLPRTPTARGELPFERGGSPSVTVRVRGLS